MKIKVPIVGEIKTGKDAKTAKAEPSIIQISAPKTSKKTYDVVGGLLSFSRTGLSTEKTVSKKILEANKEWVYRNNDVIAQEVSGLEFELFSINIRGGDIVYEAVDTHPLLDVLDRFNSRTTKSDGIYTTQSHKKLTGDAFWLLDKDNKGQINNIYILPPDKVELVLGDPAKGGDLIKEYKYEDVIDKKKVTRIYQPDEIIHFKKPNPKNPFRGYGAVEAIADSIDTDNLTNETQRNFFEKGAISNFVLTTDAKITQDQLKRLRAELRAMYSGARNAFTTMIFGNGLKPAPIGFSNKDMEFLPLLEWYRDKIMIGFGNTKASLGIIDDVNRASHESSHIAWLTGTVKPDMDSIVNTLNEFFVPLFGDNLILGYKSPIPESISDDISDAVALKNAGLITVNEAREKVGYDAVEGGDIYAPTAGVSYPNKPEEQPISPAKPNDQQDNNKNIPSSLRHMSIQHILRRRGVYKKLKINRTVKNKAIEILSKKKKVAVKVENNNTITPHFTDDVVNSYYEKQIKLVGTFEKQFEDKITLILNDIQKDAVTNLEDEISNKKLKTLVKNKELFDSEQYIVRAQIDLTPILIQQLTLAGQEAYNLLGVEDTYMPFAIEEAIKENVLKFAQSMLTTDADVMAQIISDGIKNGNSIPEIRTLLASKFSDYTKMQAERITRTEIMRASNMAAEDAFIQSGVVESKQWLLAPGACPTCLPHSGKIVGLGSEFYTPDKSGFQDGNPPVHPHCRCVLIPVVKGAKAHQQDLSNLAIQQAERIKELEAMIDENAKTNKQLRSKHTEDKAYIKALEKHLGVGDEE